MPRKSKDALMSTADKVPGIKSVADVAKEILDSVRGQIQPVKAERKKRVLSEDQKAALRERLVKAREVKASKRADKKIEQ